MIHVRFEGRSLDVQANAIALRDQMSDRELKQAIANYLRVSEDRIVDYVVDRPASGDVIIRPQAVYG